MSSRYTAPKTFLDVYNLNIAPKLKELDIFLREKENPITIWQVSQLLDMPYEEVKRLIHILQIESINHDNIFKLIMSGTSKFCELIQREVKCGFPIYYTPEDVSFIYEINVNKIEGVFETLGINEVKGDFMPFVFEMLPAGE